MEVVQGRPTHNRLQFQLHLSLHLFIVISLFFLQGCLGALDGTYINVHVPENERGRYRTKKWTISTNILAVCNRKMQFIYILPGWEGSALDARILRDAVNRTNGLKVPIVMCSPIYFKYLPFLTYKNIVLIFNWCRELLSVRQQVCKQSWFPNTLSSYSISLERVGINNFSTWKLSRALQYASHSST